MSPFVAAMALLLGSSEPSSTLQRKSHDDTIYIVRGTADQLAQFHSEIGSHWGGGRLLTKDEAQGTYRYWAYSTRTAAQARQFMFGSMSSGLFLDMVDYDERLSFRAERSVLDEISIGCGLAADPFFITPVGELEVSYDPPTTAKAISCVTEALKSAKLPNLVMQPAL